MPFGAAATLIFTSSAASSIDFGVGARRREWPTNFETLFVVLPLRDDCIVEPKGDLAAIDQGPVVLGPVADLVRNLLLAARHFFLDQRAKPS